MIDEPRTGHYYGGEIAAPVFREVMLDLRRLPDGPFGTGSTEVAAKPPAPAAVVVPDLRLLPRRAAERRLAEHGLRARFEGQGPRALAQAPAAGQAAERGASVTVWLAAPADSAGLSLPDLVGLPLREALRRLTLRQVQTRIAGQRDRGAAGARGGHAAAAGFRVPAVVRAGRGPGRARRAPGRRGRAVARGRRADRTMILRDLLQAMGAPLFAGDEGVEVRGLASDSRRVRPGDLFFALAGLRQDGRAFVRQALASGAVAAVVDRRCAGGGRAAGARGRAAPGAGRGGGGLPRPARARAAGRGHHGHQRQDHDDLPARVGLPRRRLAARRAGHDRRPPRRRDAPARLHHARGHRAAGAAARDGGRRRAGRGARGEQPRPGRSAAATGSTSTWRCSRT